MSKQQKNRIDGGKWHTNKFYLSALLTHTAAFMVLDYSIYLMWFVCICTSATSATVNIITSRCRNTLVSLC